MRFRPGTERKDQHLRRQGGGLDDRIRRNKMVSRTRNHAVLQDVHQSASLFTFSPSLPLVSSILLQAIDIWAVGCILAELLTGRPLFPGRDYSHQLDLILDVIGTPSLDEFYAITSRRSRDYIRALPIRKRRPFATLFPHASKEAIDFLSRTLVSPLFLSLTRNVFTIPQQTFDPKKRMTVDEALEHPYLSSYVRPSSFPLALP